MWLQLSQSNSSEVIQCGSRGTIQLPAPLHDSVTRGGEGRGGEGRGGEEREGKGGGGGGGEGETDG